MLTTKSTKEHEKNQKYESADICVSRNDPLTCLLLFLHFLYSFRVFSCLSWLKNVFLCSANSRVSPATAGCVLWTIKGFWFMDVFKFTTNRKSSGGGMQGGTRNCPGFPCKQKIVSITRHRRPAGRDPTARRWSPKAKSFWLRLCRAKFFMVKLYLPGRDLIGSRKFVKVKQKCVKNV